jgi:hypothetical protein
MFGKQLESRSVALCYPMLGVALMFLCRMCALIYCLIVSLCFEKSVIFWSLMLWLLYPSGFCELEG